MKKCSVIDCQGKPEWWAMDVMMATCDEQDSIHNLILCREHAREIQNMGNIIVPRGTIIIEKEAK